MAVLTNDVEQRLQPVAEQRTRAVELLDRKAQTIADMLARFGSLMNDGIYNLPVQRRNERQQGDRLRSSEIGVVHGADPRLIPHRLRTASAAARP
jgi:hypothetical protein